MIALRRLRLALGWVATIACLPAVAYAAFAGSAAEIEIGFGVSRRTVSLLTVVVMVAVGLFSLAPALERVARARRRRRRK